MSKPLKKYKKVKNYKPRKKTKSFNVIQTVSDRTRNEYALPDEEFELLKAPSDQKTDLYCTNKKYMTRILSTQKMKHMPSHLHRYNLILKVTYAHGGYDFYRFKKKHRRLLSRGFAVPRTGFPVQEWHANQNPKLLHHTESDPQSKKYGVLREWFANGRLKRLIFHIPKLGEPQDNPTELVWNSDGTQKLICYRVVGRTNNDCAKIMFHRTDGPARIEFKHGKKCKETWYIQGRITPKELVVTATVGLREVIAYICAMNDKIDLHAGVLSEESEKNHISKIYDPGRTYSGPDEEISAILQMLEDMNEKFNKILMNDNQKQEEYDPDAESLD